MRSSRARRKSRCLNRDARKPNNRSHCRVYRGCWLDCRTLASGWLGRRRNPVCSTIRIRQCRRRLHGLDRVCRRLGEGQPNYSAVSRRPGARGATADRSRRLRRHAPAWAAATASLFNCRLGPWDHHGQRRESDPLPPLFHEPLLLVADDDILVNRLRMPLACMIDARNVACLQSQVAELWAPLWTPTAEASPIGGRKGTTTTHASHTSCGAGRLAPSLILTAGTSDNAGRSDMPLARFVVWRPDAAASP